MTPLVSIGGIHLVNSSGTPTAGGAATAASTTPFSIRHGYTLGASEPVPLWSGGPPLRNGSTLIGQSYATVEERVPIAVLGSSHENAVARLQELKRALATTLYSTPPILVVQPSGSSNAMYSEVYSAVVRETTQEEFEAWEGQADLEAEIVWTRAPFFGLLSSGETLLNAASYRDTGTGSPDDAELLSTGAGDLIYEGGPLNIKFLPTTAASNPSTIYLASIANRAYAAASVSSSTTSTSFVSMVGPTIPNSALLLTNRGLKVRVMGRFSAMSANAELCLQYGLGQQTRGVIPGVGTATLVDFGQLLFPDLDRASVATTEPLSFAIMVRSTDGNAVAVTSGYVEMLFYYDFCKIVHTIGIDVSLSEYLYLDSFVVKSGYPALPRPRPQAWIYSSADLPNYAAKLRGTAPRYYSGASLYAAWTQAAGDLHTTTWAATVSAFHAPLYKTLRGSG